MKINKKIIVIFLSLLGTITAAIMVTGIKILSYELNPFIIAFYRCLFGVLIMIPFMIYNHPKGTKIIMENEKNALFQKSPHEMYDNCCKFATNVAKNFVNNFLIS